MLADPVMPTLDAGLRDQLRRFDFAKPRPLEELLAWTIGA